MEVVIKNSISIRKSIIIIIIIISSSSSSSNNSMNNISNIVDNTNHKITISKRIIILITKDVTLTIASTATT